MRTRITGELAQAGALMANSEIHWEELQHNLRKALTPTTNLGSGFSRANEKIRRKMIRANFEEILVEVDVSVICARMAQSFAAFHDEEFRHGWATSETNPGPRTVRGSNNRVVVEVMGVEPTASTLRT